MRPDGNEIDEKTPIIAVVHDVQVVTYELEPSHTDIIVDTIVTNQKKLSTKLTDVPLNLDKNSE